MLPTRIKGECYEKKHKEHLYGCRLGLYIIAIDDIVWQKEKIIEMPYGAGYYIGPVNEDNEPEGIGAYCYDIGVTCGYYHNGERNGKAVIVRDDGSVFFMGEFTDDKFNGWGLELGKSGSKYIGEFSNGERDGVGIEYFPYSGETEGYVLYKGDWRNGRYEGIGSYYSGELTYTGDYVNGERDGIGVLKMPDLQYDGSFSGGKMHGYGSLKFKNVEFDGIWKGDFVGDCYAYDENHGGLLTKFGFSVWDPEEGVPGHLDGDFESDPNVAYYVKYRDMEMLEINNFPQEVKDAAMERNIGTISGMFNGYFNDMGDPEGYGSLVFQDLLASLNGGDLMDAVIMEYRGQWENGMRNGDGYMRYTNGDEYNGLWKDDKREGPGKMTFANGDVFDGMWKDDMMHGDSCTFISHEGWTQTGRWANGEYLGSYEELNKEYEELITLAKERRARYLEILNEMNE